MIIYLLFISLKSGIHILLFMSHNASLVLSEEKSMKRILWLSGSTTQLGEILWDRHVVIQRVNGEK